MFDLTLGPEEAKLVFLAIAYHLGRPGSELDPITKQPVEHGLAEVGRDLQPQLRAGSAQISLRDNQLQRLQSAMLGSITELKAYPMLSPLPAEEGGGRRSTVRGFDRSLRHLFPEVDEDVETTMAVAERMMMLKRNLDGRLSAGPPSDDGPQTRRRGRRWWPFGG